MYMLQLIFFAIDTVRDFKLLYTDKRLIFSCSPNDLVTKV